MKFRLQPFSSISPTPNLKIVGTIQRHQTQLQLSYQLLGNLPDLLIPIPSNSPTRKDNLWQETCCEFFVRIPDTSSYWEFNLSPTGDWNVYHFEDYRQGMQNESRFTELPFQVDRQPTSLTLSLDLDLTQIDLSRQPLEIAITAVIQHTDQTITYWALTHPSSQPDFHQRESFILAL